MRTRNTIDYKGAKTVNICVVRKIGYSHAEAFREVAERIEEECRREEISCTTRSKEDKFADLNIVLGSHIEPSEILRFEKNKCLVVNLERLQNLNETKEREHYREILNTFPYIDFCRANAEYCEKEDISPPIYLYRPWFEEKWKRVINEIEKTWDVCLIGSITPRREVIIKQLEKAGLSVTYRFNCYSYERDEVLSKSKICLNVHAYENSKTAEIWRLNYLAANQVRTISETCDMEEGEEEIAEELTQASYENLTECVIKCINQETCMDRTEKGRCLHEITKKHELKYQIPHYQSKISPKPTLLNIGCGNDWREDAINIDIKSTGFEDLILNISNEWKNINTKHTTKRFGEVYLNENGFDAIEASCVLEHVENLTTALVNIIKLLKPGGWLHLKYPHQDSLGAWQDPTHLRGMNENLFKYLNEWSYYLDLQDMRAIPKWINFLEENQEGKINPRDKKRIGFVEAVLVKKIARVSDEDSIDQAKSEHIVQRLRVGNGSLREAIHRRTNIQVASIKEIKNPGTSIPTVSLLTPTFGERFKYLGLTWQWISQQNYPHDLMEWVILTDSDEEANVLKRKLRATENRLKIDINIQSTGEKLSIGNKRNVINQISAGEIMVNIDDDDYYFPDRVSHAVKKLTEDNSRNIEFAGVRYLPVFYMDDRSAWIADHGLNGSCAGSFAYKRSLIQKTWYPSQSKNGEEICFTDYWTIPKAELDAFSTMICISHQNNTFDKKQIRERFSTENHNSFLINGKKHQGTQKFFKITEIEETTPNDKIWEDLYRKLSKTNHMRPLSLSDDIFCSPKGDVIEKLANFTLQMLK